MSEETGTILAHLNAILSRAYCDFIFINCTIHSGPSGIPGHSLYGNDKESFFPETSTQQFEFTSLKRSVTKRMETITILFYLLFIYIFVKK